MEMEQKRKGQRRIRRIVLISLISLMVFSIGSIILVKTIYDGHFPRVYQPKYSGYLRYGDVKNKYERTMVKFQSGDNNLTGYIYGNTNKKGLVVIAHGHGFGAEDYLPETIYFADNGWRVFSYDCTGTYESEGKTTVGLPQSVIDLDAALNFIEGNHDFDGLPVMLYGHSWGGYAVTAILHYNHTIAAVASISGFSSPMQLFFDTSKSMMGPFAYIEYPFEWAYQSMLFGKTSQITAVDGINHVDTPVMIIHGKKDQDVLYDGASIITHRNEITNPNVVYKTCSDENRNDHRNLFKSKSAVEYALVLNAEYKEIYNSYNGKIPDEAKEKFYASVDKFKVSERDADFMNDINSFFEKCLEVK